MDQVLELPHKHKASSNPSTIKKQQHDLLWNAVFFPVKLKTGKNAFKIQFLDLICLKWFCLKNLFSMNFVTYFFCPFW
jgi:antibiotic biosynthesis monooxygenase (ABM) superfamily enzyme